MSGILDLIDSAIEDYSVSGDAMRCSPDRPMVQPRVARDHSPLRVQLAVRGESTPEQSEAFLAVCRELAQQWMISLGHAVEAVNEVGRHLQAAGVIPPPPPADPMQRALEARRNRNTGPAARRRGPQRIDPQRAR